MTQDEYQLYTGMTVNYSTSDWTKLVSIASNRLASFLCLSNGLPTPLPDDLKMVLANFIAGMIKHQGGAEQVESKHVRNFTINFKTTASTNAFAEIASQYGDIIEQYSNCGIGFAVEHSKGYCCGRI